MNTTILGLNAIDVSNRTNAQTTITSCQNAIDKVSNIRSLIGAQQNRLEYSKNIDDNISENTQSAESRIRDANISDAVIRYSKEKILEQIGQSILTQANQNASNIILLLK